VVAGSNPVSPTSEIAGGSDIPPLLRVPSRGMYSNGYSNPCGGPAKKTIVKGHHGEEEKTVETTRWPATGKGEEAAGDLRAARLRWQVRTQTQAG
jgi:hypothetical protein